MSDGGFLEAALRQRQAKQLEEWADRFPPPPPMPECPTCDGTQLLSSRGPDGGRPCPNCDNGTVPVQRLIDLFNRVMEFRDGDGDVMVQRDGFCRYLINEWRRT